MSPTAALLFLFLVLVILCSFRTGVYLEAVIHSSGETSPHAFEPPISGCNAEGNINERTYTSTAFRWDALDTAKPGICGHHKCFFRSRIDPSSEYSEGYLIALSDEARKAVPLGWERAMRLEKRYGMAHIYPRDSPPEIVPTSNRQWHFAKSVVASARKKQKVYHKINATDFLERADNATGFLERADCGGRNTDTAAKSNHTFLVQRVEVFPEPNLEWGDNHNRRKRCNKNFASVASTVHQGGKSAIEAFSARMLRDIQTLNKSLDEEAWLVSDIQVIVDTTGRIFHFDLERGKNKPRKELVPNFQHRRDVVMTLLEKLRLSFANWPYKKDGQNATTSPPICENLTEIDGEYCAC